MLIFHLGGGGYTTYSGAAVTRQQHSVPRKANNYFPETKQGSYFLGRRHHTPATVRSNTHSW